MKAEITEKQLLKIINLVQLITLLFWFGAAILIVLDIIGIQTEFYNGANYYTLFGSTITLVLCNIIKRFSLSVENQHS